MRLPNGYGSVYKLSGKRRKPWAARKTTGWEHDHDKMKSFPIYQFIGYFSSRKEALEALISFNENPYDMNFEKLTFGEVYDKWSRVHYETIKNTNGYKAAYEICRPLVNLRFKEIKLQHLQKVVDESGKNKPTLRNLKTLIGLLYDYAVVHEIVTPDKREMARYLDIKRAGNPNALKRAVFRTEDIELLWQSSQEDEYISVVLILIYTGLRIGELLALKKEDIHLDERWFFIRASKTEAGIREVPIAEKIVPLFEHWMNKDSDHLICTPEHHPFKYRNYYDSYWIPIMVRLGLGELIPSGSKPAYDGHRPHDTRHTCVSLLTGAGVDSRIIKSIVGHRGQGITETVYTHLEHPLKIEAINKI